MPKTHDPLFLINLARDIILGVVAAVSGFVVWQRRRSARHWPMTYGKVEFGMCSDTDGWKANLSYSYSIAGQFYSGVFPLKARNEAEADEIVHKWKGRPVAIRYSPFNPTISVVRAEDEPGLQ